MPTWINSLHAIIATALTVVLMGRAWCGDAEATAAPQGWSQDHRLLYYGIPVQVVFHPADAPLAAESWAYLDGIDRIFNDYKDDSEIGRINAAGRGTYELSPDLAEAFAVAIRLNRLTGGAFDITVGPLRRIWRQAEKDGHLPTADAVTAALGHIGPATFSLDGHTLTVRRSGVAFDFGGLIKGMAVDHVIARLRAADRDAALVQCGGETACYGRSPRAAVHRVGIPDPSDQTHLWCTLTDHGTGLCGSTSGNYLNAITIEGQDYYHIFDPRSGRPAATHVLSASVAFAHTGANGLAEGLAKLGVLDPDRFLATVHEQGGEGMVLVRRADGTVDDRRTSGWSTLLADAPLQATSP